MMEGGKTQRNWERERESVGMMEEIKIDVIACLCVRVSACAGPGRDGTAWNCSLCLKPLSVPLWSDGLLIPDDKLLQGLNKNCSELHPVPHSSTYCIFPTIPCHASTGTLKPHTAFQLSSYHKYSNKSSTPSLYGQAVGLSSQSISRLNFDVAHSARFMLWIWVIFQVMWLV